MLRKEIRDFIIEGGGVVVVAIAAQASQEPEEGQQVQQLDQIRVSAQATTTPGEYAHVDRLVNIDILLQSYMPDRNLDTVIEQAVHEAVKGWLQRVAEEEGGRH